MQVQLMQWLKEVCHGMEKERRLQLMQLGEVQWRRVGRLRGRLQLLRLALLALSLGRRAVVPLVTCDIPTPETPVELRNHMAVLKLTDRGLCDGAARDAFPGTGGMSNGPDSFISRPALFAKTRRGAAFGARFARAAHSHGRLEQQQQSGSA